MVHPLYINIHKSLLYNKVTLLCSKQGVYREKNLKDKLLV